MFHISNWSVLLPSPSAAGWCCSEQDGEGLWHTKDYPEKVTYLLQGEVSFSVVCLELGDTSGAYQMGAADLFIHFPLNCCVLCRCGWMPGWPWRRGTRGTPWWWRPTSGTSSGRRMALHPREWRWSCLSQDCQTLTLREGGDFALVLPRL